MQSSAGSFERPSLSTRAHGPSWTSGHVISADTCAQRPGTRVCLRGTLQEETERNEGAPAQASPEEPAQKPRHKVRGGGRGSRAPRIPTMQLLPGVGSALQAAASEWRGGAQAGLRAPPERLWSSSPRQRQFGIYPGPSRHYPPLTAFQGLNADHMQSCPPAQPPPAALRLAPCRMGNRGLRGEKQQTDLLSTKQNSKHFSCILGFPGNGRLFKKYLAQIEHLLDMMET